KPGLRILRTWETTFQIVKKNHVGTQPPAVAALAQRIRVRPCVHTAWSDLMCNAGCGIAPD
ncbi:MAG: hypothetical protein U1A73_18200, partial [Pseudomonas sp.]|nr:hypothetical protein [Pseudomonas sp.]